MRLSSMSGILGSHAGHAFDAAVANRVTADDLRCPGLRRGTAIPVAVADVETDTVGPFDGVAFNDPVIAAGGGYQAALRNRVTVAAVLESDSLDADIGKTLLQGDEGLLAGGDFDQCDRRECRRAYGREWPFPEFSTQNLASGEPPISCMIGTAASASGQAGADGAALVGRRGAGQRARLASSRNCSTGSSGLPSKKTNPRRRKYGPMSTFLGVQPGPIARRAGQGEGVVGIGEHRAGEFVLPGCWIRPPGLPPKPRIETDPAASRR